MRLFVGLQLPARWREAMAGELAALGARGVRGRFTRPDNLHLTLVFLGELPSPQPVQALLEELACPPPFPLRTAPPGRFRRKGGDVWWLGVERSPQLLELQAGLERALRQAGFPLEARPYTPHITLARQVKSPPNPLERLSLPALETTVRRVTLFSSQQVDGALRYLPLYHKSLI